MLTARTVQRLFQRYERDVDRALADLPQAARSAYAEVRVAGCRTHHCSVAA